MNVSFQNLALRHLNAEDGRELYRLVDRNRYRLQNYFPVTVNTLASLSGAFKYVDDKLKEEAEKMHYTFVLEAADHTLQGAIFIKNIDWRVPKAELAYFIDESLEGRGIMTRAISEVVQFGFGDLDMNKMYIITSVDNTASRKMAEKNGFETEGILRSNFRIATGELIDMVYYGILRKT